MGLTDNPLVAAATSAAATFAFCVTIVVPTWTKSLENDLAEANKELSDERRNQKEVDEKLASISQVTKPLNDKIASLQNNLSLLEKKLSQTNIELEILRSEKMFTADDLYPAGHRKVKIGRPSKDITSAYPVEAMERNRDLWITVQLDGPVFDSATYHIEQCGKTELVTRASFHLKKPNEWPVIAAKAEATYGENFWTLYENKYGDRELRSQIVKGSVAELDQPRKDGEELLSSSFSVTSEKPLRCGDAQISYERMKTVVGPRKIN